MNRKLALPLLLGLLIVTALFFHPQSTSAEIATARDWIGVFPPTNSTHLKSDSIAGWKYSGNCSSTVVPTVPKLADPTGCTFTIPPSITPGAYEYRLYANGIEGNADALIAQSKILWSPFDITNATCTNTGSTLTVNLSWPALNGISGISVTRRSGVDNQAFNLSAGSVSYTNIVTNPKPQYTYTLTASAPDNRGSRGAERQFSVTATNNTSCTVSFITPVVSSSAVSCPIYTDTGFNPIVLDSATSGDLLSVVDQSKLGTYSTGDKCVIGGKAAIPDWSLISYASMKSVYFDQSKSTSKAEYVGGTGEGQLSLYLNSSPPKKLIHIIGNLGINNNIGGSNTAVVFVDGNLNFVSPMTQFTYGSSNSGIVFVVQGDVNIDPAVTRIDANIMTYGTFCSYFSGGNCPLTTQETASLTINGSIISLDSSKPPQFKRTVGNNLNPAETVDYLPKYLVIMKDIFSKDLSIWSELTGSN